jgi:hypothetical protein
MPTLTVSLAAGPALGAAEAVADEDAPGFVSAVDGVSSLLHPTKASWLHAASPNNHLFMTFLPRRRGGDALGDGEKVRMALFLGGVR